MRATLALYGFALALLVEACVLIIIHLDEGTVLQRLSSDVQSLQQEVHTFMTATKGQFDTLISMFNAETNSLATRLDALKLQLASALANGDRSMTAAETQAVFDELTAVSGRLTALAADPANPLPDNPPVPATGS